MLKSKTNLEKQVFGKSTNSIFIVAVGLYYLMILLFLLFLVLFFLEKRPRYFFSVQDYCAIFFHQCDCQCCRCKDE
jgi:hypothetical protein